VKTLVLGIGNPILGDDGVGVHVAQELAKEIRDKDIDIKDASFDGLNLLELIAGYDKLIVIDAIMADDKVGEIYKLTPESISDMAGFTTSPHHSNLASTIEMGEKLFPERMPKEVTIFAVGTQEVVQVTEEMTGKVSEAIPKVVSLVSEEISSASSDRQS